MMLSNHVGKKSQADFHSWKGIKRIDKLKKKIRRYLADRVKGSVNHGVLKVLRQFLLIVQYRKNSISPKVAFICGFNPD